MVLQNPNKSYNLVDPSLLDPKSGPVKNSDIPKNTSFGSPELKSDLDFSSAFNSVDVRNFNDSSNPSNASNTNRSGSDSVTKSPPPKRYGAASIKEKLLKPAHTSHFDCYLKPTIDVINWCTTRGLNYNDPNMQALIHLSCSEASLPGSRIATLELNDDHHGVRERHAYRRQFDDTVSLTFYVDAPKVSANHGYNLIWFFEQWKSFIVDENYVRDGNVQLDDNNWYYRAKFPATYMTDIFINKFERDYDLSQSTYASKGFPESSTKKYLEYKFLQAYPISINSMPVSYEQSQLLKCTVSFAYSRYIVRRKTYGQSGSDDPAYANGETGPKVTPSPVPKNQYDIEKNIENNTSIPKPKVNPDSSFRKNLNVVTPEDKELIKQELELF